MAYLSYKYRIYPNKTQKRIIMKTFGCVRLVYNRCLELERDAEKIGDPPIGQKELLSFLSQVLCFEYPFLNDVDYNTLCHAVFNLFNAYRMHWDHSCNPPVFKSRNSTRYTFCTGAKCGNLDVGDNYVAMSVVGKVRAVIHRPLPKSHRILNFTVSQEPDKSYYCSVLFSYGPTVSNQKRDYRNSIGLDYCAKGLFTDSNGNICNAPRYNMDAERKLKRALKKLSRKQGYDGSEKLSKNYLKQRRQVNKIYRQIANRRNDFLQKKSTELTSEYDLICVEGLNMREMSNRREGFGKSTMDNAYGKFLEMLSYKARDKGKCLFKIDRWFPSSQICSNCGYQQKLGLNQRVFCCPKCGLRIDRDYNAAININREGLRKITMGR